MTTLLSRYQRIWIQVYADGGCDYWTEGDARDALSCTLNELQHGSLLPAEQREDQRFVHRVQAWLNGQHQFDIDLPNFDPIACLLQDRPTDCMIAMELIICAAGHFQMPHLADVAKRAIVAHEMTSCHADFLQLLLSEDASPYAHQIVDCYSRNDYTSLAQWFSLSQA